MRNWEKNEVKDARAFGATRRPRSGGFYEQPGDYKDKYFLYDSKLTIHKSYAITEKTWDKLYHEALRDRRFPALVITLGNGTEVVVLSKLDFIEIKEQYSRMKDLED